MIVVTGATGNVGGKIAAKLLSEGRKVRAIARHQDRLRALAAQGAEIAAGDMSDAAFLARAYSGAEAVFTMVPPDLSTPDVAAYYDRFSGSIVRALRESGVKYVVDLSSMGAHTEKDCGIVANLARHEKRMDALPGVNILHLRPGYFMENFLANMPMVKQMGILGSALRPDVPIPLIATADIAAYAAERLVKKDFSGKAARELLGARDYTMQQAASILGKAIGKPDLPYVQFSYADAKQAMVGVGISASIADGYNEMSRGLNETDNFRGKDRNSENTTPTTLEAFAPIFAAAYQA